MSRACWRVTEFLAGLLEPDERDACLGDLAESCQTGSQALRDVFGLVARRQAALWTKPRCWLAFVGLVVPFGTVLSLIVRRTADGTAVYAWLYLNNWTAGYLSSGFRQDLFRTVTVFVIFYLALACWAWSAGYILGFVSRHCIGLVGLMYFLVLLLGEVSLRGDHQSIHDAVFSLTFYRAVLPMLLLGILVFLPAFRGMLDGCRCNRVARPLERLMWLCLTVTIATLVAMVLKPHWRIRTSSFAGLGPLSYIVLIADRRRHGHFVRIKTPGEQGS